MTGRPRIPLCVAGLLFAGALALPTAAAGQEVTAPETVAPADPGGDGTGSAADAVEPARAPKADGRKPAHISVGVHGIHRDGKVRVGKPVRAFGYLRPFVPGEHVRVKLLRQGKVVRNVNPEVNKVPGKNKGRFNFRSKDIIKPGTYKVLAMHKRSGKQRRDVDRSQKFGVHYPDVDPGNRSSVVKVFNRVLKRQGYFTSGGKKYSVRTKWAVMAFRKVNGMKRTFNANPKIFRRLADGRGEYDLKYPGKGKHVEVDISKQVMVLAKRRKPQHTFAVSTGAPATPTIRGHYRFYRKDAGYNSVGMYYSAYFRGGYATHGYHSVPTYPASHGCVRNPIPNSIFIYNWISLGDSIYVYG